MSDKLTSILANLNIELPTNEVPSIQPPANAVIRSQVDNTESSSINQANSSSTDNHLTTMTANDMTPKQLTANDGKLYNCSFRHNYIMKKRIEALTESLENEGATFSLNKYLTNLVDKDLKSRGF